MVADRQVASQVRGAESADALEGWAKVTPIQHIPRNQFGRASRAVICRKLGIALSTVGSNNRVRDVFIDLDARLASSVLPSEITKADPSSAGGTDELSLLRQYCADLRAENATLTSRLKRLEYLENTGLGLS